MPVVTEVTDPRLVEMVSEYADMLQVGARNMQNFVLLTEVGKSHRPVLLKRGMSATINDLADVRRIHPVAGQPQRHFMRTGNQGF